MNKTVEIDIKKLKELKDTKEKAISDGKKIDKNG
jgi:hypothetical protein